MGPPLVAALSAPVGDGLLGRLSFERDDDAVEVGGVIPEVAPSDMIEEEDSWAEEED